MPWQPLPRIAFAVATYPFTASSPADLPLELGDELYIIEEGGKNGAWFRGYLIAPPSLLAGLTSMKGQTLEARVFSGIFPRSCVEVREVLGGAGEGEEIANSENEVNGHLNGITNGHVTPRDSNGSENSLGKIGKLRWDGKGSKRTSQAQGAKPPDLRNGIVTSLSIVAKRDSSGVKPPAPVPMLKIGDETPTSTSEPLVDEIASCLREWQSTNLHELLLSRKYSLLDKMASLVNTLDLSRRQLLHNVLTTQELQALREKTVWELVRGNKIFNGEVIVRDPAERGRVLTGDDSPVEITKLQSMMSLLDERPQPTVDVLTLHHLLVDFKTFVGASSEPTTLVFYLASKAPGATAVALSESYIVDLPSTGTLNSIAKAGSMRTLFTDLTSVDIGDVPGSDAELYLVVKVRQTQTLILQKKPISRGGSVSRDGDSRNPSDRSSISTVGGKAARKSLMWGKNAQRAAFSRNSPISKMNAVSENDEPLPESRGGPPSTAGSRDENARVKTGTANDTVQRTVGVGALKLSAIVKHHEEVEHLMNIWTPSARFDLIDDHGEGWDNVINDLMNSKSGNFEKSRNAERLQLDLRAFISGDSQALIKATPTVLSDITCTSKMGFSGAPTKPRSDIYITVDEAFLPRHALLSRSAGSAVPVSPTLGGPNLRLVLDVRKTSGEKIEKCIYSSSNSEPVTSWESTVAERGNSWSETLRLVVTQKDVQGAHIFITISDAPNPPFALCHIPLWDQQAFLRDGHHSLLLYRYDSIIASARPVQGTGGYLALPWNSRGKDDVSKDEAVTGPIATLRLQTYLCSTLFSQDKVLLGILKWREQSPVDLQALLKRLVFVPEIEIVKLLNDVLDSIFGILVDHAGNDDYEDLIFSSLVTVLGIVHDRRFNLGPLVDQYAENRFNYPFATPCLVRSFTRLLENPTDPEVSRKLRATFKVVRHILKFITHARDQQKAKEADIGITSTSPGFTRHLRSIFKALDSLMRNATPLLVGSQTLAVQHFHSWLPELTGLLTTEEILHIAIDFMDSCSSVKGKLVLYKLVLIINYSRLELFSQPDQRSALAANTVRWIAPHWGKPSEVNDQYRDQVRLCCSVLATQADMLNPEVPDYTPKIIDSYLAIQAAPKQEKTRLSLLFPTAYPFPSKPIAGKPVFDEALVELSAILSAVSGLPNGMQLELAEDEMATLLYDTLHVHLSILECEAFPASWLSVRIYHHKSTMKTLQYLASILLESFLPSPDEEGLNYNVDLWKVFFTTLLKLVGSDALALETFPEQKRRAVWKIAGDVREAGAELLRHTWEANGWESSPEDRRLFGLAKMGGYQVQYVPALVGPIVELCLSVHEGLRHVAVEVLETMIISEWTMNEDLSVIQTEMIDCLDRLFKSKPLTESILQKLFINELLDLFAPLASKAVEDALYGAIKDLIATTDEFLDLLVAIHSTDVTGEASHLMHRLRLMDFLRDMQKEEIFIRYVHQLASLQADAMNFTEAGLALRLHADIYEWEPSVFLPALAEPEFPAQSQFDRKEKIYFEMIKHFEDGEAWSSALAAYKELQYQYEENVFDFPKLARTQRAIATIYETISKSDKLTPKYFRVTYKGMGFPVSLRDKDFVFEGSPMERTSAFTDRMQEQHPSAQIVTTGDVEDVEGQFLQILALSHHRDLDHHVFQRARVPHVVRDYLLSSHSQQFSTTSRRITAGPVTEHFVEKIVYTTAEAFPTILRRSEIVAVDKIKLSAEQTALERIIRKTVEISLVEKRIIDGEDDQIPLLIEALDISVSSTSDSSVSRYRELLPVAEASEEEDEEEPQEVQSTPLQNALRMALIDHAIMIKRCLAMFLKAPNHQLRSSHFKLTQNFESTFAPELATLVPQQRRTPTPTPPWQLANPVDTTQVLSPNRNSSLPHSATNGTIITTDTSILDTPPPKGHQLQKSGSSSAAARGRLSFLNRAGSVKISEGPRGELAAESVLFKPVANGVVQGDDSSLHSRESRDRSKENSRRSFFGAGGVVGETGDGGDGDWVTDHGYESQVTSRGLPQRNNSINRSDTSSSVGSRVGSVRKRLSMLKLGKKTSKVSVLVDSVAEE